MIIANLSDIVATVIFFNSITVYRDNFKSTENLFDKEIYQYHKPDNIRMSTIGDGLPIGQVLGCPAPERNLNSPGLLGHYEVEEISEFRGTEAILPSIPNLEDEVRRLAGNIAKRTRDHRNI